MIAVCRLQDFVRPQAVKPCHIFMKWHLKLGKNHYIVRLRTANRRNKNN